MFFLSFCFLIRKAFNYFSPPKPKSIVRNYTRFQGRFRLGVRKNFFPEGVVRLSMEVFEERIDVVLGDVVNEQYWW